MPQPGNPLKEWAVFAYFAGNVPETEMHAAAVDHLLEMARVGSTDDVYMAAQIYLPGLLPRRYILPKASPLSDPIKVTPDPSQPNANSADPRSILDFVQWAAGSCPAKSTMVILWGHGYGIDDYVPPRAHLNNPQKGIGALRMVAPPVQNKDLSSSLSNVSTISAFYEFFSDMIYDWPHGAVIPNTQIGQAIRAASQSLNAKLKPAILGFDSCEMAMAEVWHEMVDCAAFGVSSQAPIPYQGWPYGVFLKQLVLKPKAAPDAVARMIVDAFVASYADEKDAYITLSALNLAAIGDLTKSLKSLSESLTAVVHDRKARQAIFEARNYCPIFDPDGFIDLGCFCEFLKNTLSNSKISTNCDSVIQALDAFVMKASYSPPDSQKKISQSTGLSVWFPAWIQNPSVDYLEKSRSVAYLAKGYPETRFAQDTGWDQFLKALRNASRKR